MDRRRIHFFGDYLNSLGRPCTAVEIGVNKGEYLFEMINYCKQVTWYGVDPYIVYEPFSTRFTMPPKKEWDSMFLAISQRISNHPYHGRIKLIRKTSVDAVRDVPDNLDLVYIDGDHNCEAVLKDIVTWESKVRPGGIIGGHDYNKIKDCYRKIFSGVIQAVDTYSQRYDRQLMEDVLGNWYWWVK